MKTSNRLILGFLLAFYGAILLIHGVLYGEYRNGHFVTAEQMHAENFVRHALPAPRVIAIDGAIWVNLIPGRQFALELPRRNEDPDAGMFESTPSVTIKGVRRGEPAIAFEQRDDTLFIRGNTLITVHRPFNDWIYRRNLPQVNIYGSMPDGLLLDHGQFYLQGGEDSAGRRSARITLRNSTLWVGMQYEHRRGPAEYFDSLDISSSNSIVVLSRESTITGMRVTLADSSTLTDRYSTLTHSIIRASPDSHIDLSAGNLKRNPVITP